MLSLFYLIFSVAVLFSRKTLWYFYKMKIYKVILFRGLFIAVRTWKQLKYICNGDFKAHFVIFIKYGIFTAIKYYGFIFIDRKDVYEIMSDRSYNSICCLMPCM